MIARRSRHYAGTRYLKRGINVHGKAANDCEIEQVVQRDDGYRSQFCSYLQMRGSIPTYWYQETSVTMPKPPILINRTDPDYQATEVGKDVTLSPSIGLLFVYCYLTPQRILHRLTTTYPKYSSGTHSRLVSQIQLAHNRTGFGEAAGEEAPRVSSRIRIQECGGGSERKHRLSAQSEVLYVLWTDVSVFLPACLPAY